MASDSSDGIFKDKLRVQPKTAEERELASREWAMAAKRAKTSAAAPEDVEEWAVVVDPSPSFLTMISAILKSLNMGVHPFRSPQAALTHLKDCSEEDLFKTVAVFSEVELPDMQGHEFLHTLRATERTKEIPFVIVTNVTDKPTLAQLVAGGIHGCVMKPFKEQAIIDRVMAINVERQKKLTEMLAKMQP